MNVQHSTSPSKTGGRTADWWRGGVIYQIYPRSFQDSNDDGIGDLAGITARLGYVAALGVDAIWISPFFTSPMKDFGYDVSDYRDVDPMFGTLADFDKLVETAHGLGLHVMIDLVISHSSDQHPWFAESRQSRDNPRSDWYVWADPKPDGTPPNNWLSIFGGSAWQWDARREQYYLHNFLTSQPDLNFHNPAVQDALLAAARFWLERGVDGFRLDTVNFYTHDKYLRDNPPLAPEERDASIAPSVNPYNHQNHMFSKSRPENILFLKKLRALTDEFGGRACLGEVGDAQRGLEILGEYTSGNDRLHMCYAFEFLNARKPTADYVCEVFENLAQKAPGAWACWAFSNHDVMRHRSRWNLSEAQTRGFAALLFCLRGSVCIYQGEELGLSESDVAFEDLQDPYGKEFWPEYKGRDGCRTPMIWERDNANAGFSGGKPWLPVNASELGHAAAVQAADDGSMLRHYQMLVALRHAHPAIATGEVSGMTATDDILQFLRVADDETVFCAFNLGDGTARLGMPPGNWQNIAADLGGVAIETNEKTDLQSGQFVIARKVKG